MAAYQRGVSPRQRELTGLLQGHAYYVETGLLGKGTFGTVIEAVDTRENADMDTVAIKFIERGPLVKNYRTYIKREILHHSCLRHPLVICLKEVFLTPTHLAIAMEFAPGGDLFKYVTEKNVHGKLREDQARWVFQQLVIGLDYCHRRGVANRDLKLENLLLDHDGSNGHKPLLKICDFGFSKHESNSTAKTSVGTQLYMAPEVLLGRSKYDAKVADIWSCGIVLYAMLCGRYPFDTKDSQYLRKVLQAEYAIPPDVYLSPECRDLLRLLLVPNPEDRMSLAGIKAHPWFMTDLPPGALEMNNVLLNDPTTMEDYDRMISEIVDEAVSIGPQHRPQYHNHPPPHAHPHPHHHPHQHQHQHPLPHQLPHQLPQHQHQQHHHATPGQLKQQWVSAGQQ